MPRILAQLERSAPRAIVADFDDELDDEDDEDDEDGDDRTLVPEITRF